jgi:hypothetical protein
MRRILAVAGSALLALALTVPVVVADGPKPEVTGITVTSATVARTGEVRITGTLYCQWMDGWNIGTQGQLIQAIGHKTTIRGGIGGGVYCNPTGPSDWEVWAWADSGTFGPGWATLQIGFNWNCDEFGKCEWLGGDNFVVKVTKR